MADLNAKLLIADGNQEMRKIVRDILHRAGFMNTVGASDGVAALKRVESQELDLVIADWHLPHLSGIEILEKVRANEETEDLLFIMLGSDHSPAHIARAGELGAQGYILKPFNPQTLLSKVEQILDARDDPGNLDKLLKMSAAYNKVGKHREAIELLERAFQASESREATLHYNLGQVHREMENLEEAEKSFKASTDTNPQFTKALRALGELRFEQGDYNGALEVTEKAVSISPFNVKSQNLLADCFLETGNPERASFLFKKVLRMDPNAVHVYNRMGIALRQQKNYREALKAYHNALTVEPNSERLHYNLALVYHEMGDTGQAVAMLRKALALNKNFHPARELLAEIEGQDKQ